MKKISILAAVLILFLALPASALQPNQIFEMNKKSVGLIKTKDGLGSGVVIAKEIVLTNCHVIAGQDKFEYIEGSHSFPAVLVAGNTELDLCKIKVPGLSAKPVKIRDLSDIKIGERVYAIGNPRGLQLTISEGLISGVRDFDDIVVLQTTAPISPGSSGGGLFDTDGRLVGITTSMLTNSQNINFAVPAKFAQNLKKMISVAVVEESMKLVNPPSDLLRDAKKGNPESQYKLGEMYYLGEGVAQDYKEAVKWYKLAAEQGYAKGRGSLGVMYDSGYGVAQDYKEAAKWYQLAADQGDAYSQRNLGNLYYLGEGVAQDYKEAVKWYKLAADQGDASAENHLGDMYAKGWGVAKDYYEAVKWYRLAADQRDDDAQYNLGNMYAKGLGVAQDYREAIKWYKLASEQVNNEAKYALGIMYLKGRGVLQDYEEAVKWLKNASAYAPAKCILAELYVSGHVSKRYMEAKQLAKEGYDAGEEYCKEVYEKYHLANY